MRRAALIITVLFFAIPAFAESDLQKELKAHMNFLTDPLLEGRAMDTMGESISALYIKTEMEKFGLDVSISSYSFKESLPSSHKRHKNPLVLVCKNVVSVLKGSGKDKKEIIVLSAHFDGVGNSVGKRRGDGLFRPAANDDGSGTSALLALGKKISKRKWNRTIMLIAFGGEEQGLLGSAAYVKSISTQNFKYNIQMDMVGRPMKDPDVPWPKVFLTGDDNKVPEVIDLFRESEKNPNSA